MAIENIRNKADEVAELMASRFGGLSRGHRADLKLMLRRRGGALPRRLRKQAYLLADAGQLVSVPKRARQLDRVRLDKAHAALVAYLRPLGALNRFQGRATGIAAAVVLGLLMIGLAAIWIMVLRGYL